MTVLAFIIGGTVAIGWLAALALLIYGLVTQHSFIEGICSFRDCQRGVIHCVCNGLSTTRLLVVLEQ